MNLIQKYRLFAAARATKRMLDHAREEAEKMEPGKPLLKSKTFWVNVLVGAGEVVGLWEGVIPPKYAPYLVAGHSTINIILRVITSDAITSFAVQKQS